MSKKILVLKNQGTLELESHEWMDLHTYNYQRITIDNKNTYLLKEPHQDNFYSFNDKISDIDGAIVFVLNSPPDVIREILDILKAKNIPYVLLMEESSKEISQRENEVFAIDKNVESLILALNKLSALIDQNIEKKSDPAVNDENNEINTYNTENDDVTDKTDNRASLELDKSKKELLEEYALHKTSHHATEITPESSNISKELKRENQAKPLAGEVTENLVDYKSDSSALGEPRDKLKKIKFFLHPIMMTDVKCSLERLGFSNITITDIKYLDADKKKETYRGGHYNTGLSPRLEAWIVVRESEVEYILDSLAELKNDDINENAVISDIEEVIRISSLERGDLAID